VFEIGATYRARHALPPFRDAFDPGERLVFFRHAFSIHEDMNRWLFHVVDAPGKIRSWDSEADAPQETPFERIADVAPIVSASAANDADSVGRLAASCDAAYLLVALDVAVGADRPEIVRVLTRSRKLPTGALETALQAAAASNKLEATRALLGEGVRSDEALWCAVWSGSTENVELLIAHGADPGKMSQPIDGAVAFCERQGYAEIARILHRHK
jgi:hypothetical protein